MVHNITLYDFVLHQINMYIGKEITLKFNYYRTLQHCAQINPLNRININMVRTYTIHLFIFIRISSMVIH